MGRVSLKLGSSYFCSFQAVITDWEGGGRDNGYLSGDILLELSQNSINLDLIAQCSRI